MIKMLKIIVLSFYLIGVHPIQSVDVDCNKLRIGQFICPHPDVIDTYIDPKTQQPKGCTQQNKADGELQKYLFS